MSKHFKINEISNPSVFVFILQKKDKKINLESHIPNSKTPFSETVK